MGLTTLGLPCAASAMPNPYSGHGWFWYQMPPPPPKTPSAPPPATPAPVPTKKPAPRKSEAPPLSVAWIKKHRHQYLIKAIDDPTPKNVRAFMYVNNAMYDKAQDFANMFFYQAHFDTALNPTMTAPTTQAGLNAFYAKETAGKKSALQYLAKNTGIFFFFSNHCPYCKLQNIQLRNFLADEKGGYQANWHVRYISMDGVPLPGMNPAKVVKDTGQAKFMKLVETPALVLAIPPKTFIVLSQGEAISAVIKDQLLRAAIYYHLVPHDLGEDINPYMRGVITPAQFREAAKQKLNSPDQVVRLLHQDTMEKLKNW